MPMLDRPASDSADLVVVGAGIVGLATARAFLLRRPGSSVVVLEKEDDVGLHQTGHNSGVVHSGIYYRPGSTKARLCVRGAREMVELCRERGIPVAITGKVIVALERSELGWLDELERRAAANGVPGVRRLGPADIRDLEPEAAGIAGLHCPSTAVVDYRAVTRALLEEVVDHGGRVECGFPVASLSPSWETSGMAVVRAADGRVERAGRVVVCAGLQSDRLLARPPRDEPRLGIVPFRGSYYDLTPRAAALVRSMIYPVPDPRFPFLGVHFTRHVDGTVSCGPNAVLGLARERYRHWSPDWRDVSDTLRFPGFWRLARREWRAQVGEVARDLSRRWFHRQARRYLPALSLDDLRPGMTGVRAQAVDEHGRLLDDFAFRSDGPILHVMNAPSPAATASLSIGEAVVDRCLSPAS